MTEPETRHVEAIAPFEARIYLTSFREPARDPVRTTSVSVSHSPGRADAEEGRLPACELLFFRYNVGDDPEFGTLTARQSDTGRRGTLALGG
jgi:hypothetical protein